MKTVIKYFAACTFSIAIACSCTNLSEINERIDDLESRVTALETQINTLNGNVEALQALAGGGTIKSVTQQGDTYTIETSNGTQLVIKQGSIGIGNAPIMSIDKDGWWMADYQDGKGAQYVLQDGNKVMAIGQNGVTPQFGIDSEDYWTVSYDGGKTFSQVTGADGKPVKAIASGEASDSYFKDVKVEGEKLTVTLKNGDVYSIPVVSDFYCIITCGEEADEYKYNDAKSYPVEMSGVSSTVVTAPDGWRAVLSENSLKVTAPAGPVAATKASLADSRTDVSIIAFSAEGYGTVAKVHVKLSGDPSHDTPVASVTAGESTITSVSFNVKVEDATEWYYLVLPAADAAPGIADIMGGTKCTEMTKTITVEASGELTPYTCYVLPVNGTTFGTIVSTTATSAAYANKYEAYQSGKTITVGGRPLSKAVDGEATLISEDTEWNNSSATPGGVFFIAEGKTLTITNFRPKTSLIILGEKPGNESNLILTSSIIPQAENLEFIFSSLNFSIRKNALLYGAKNVPLVGFYSCKMDITNANNFSLTATSKIANAEFDSCDINIASSSVGVFDGSKNAGVKIATLIFNNNTVYSIGSVRSFQLFRQGRASIVDAVGTVKVTNNIFYDVTFASGLCSPKTLDAFYLENNIFSYSASNTSYQRCLWISDDNDQAKTAPVAGYPAAGKVSGNFRFNTDRIYACMNPDQRLGDKSWYPTDYKEITTAPENPFSAVDLAKGTFTKKADFASIGANR